MSTSGSNPGSEPRTPGHFPLRRHSQAVRQRSAKPSSPVRFRVAPPKRKHPIPGCFRFLVAPLLHRAGLRPRFARSGIRSASAARRSTSSLVRRRARGYCRNTANSETIRPDGRSDMQSGERLFVALRDLLPLAIRYVAPAAQRDMRVAARGYFIDKTMDLCYNKPRMAV